MKEKGDFIAMETFSLRIINAHPANPRYKRGLSFLKNNLRAFIFRQINQEHTSQNNHQSNYLR